MHVHTHFLTFPSFFLFSSAAQHSSRQAVMQSASYADSGRSQASIAGQIGVTTNPQVSSGGQHAARVSIINASAGR